jgi:Gram-negative bacterial TonB protein C-terminal
MRIAGIKARKIAVIPLLVALACVCHLYAQENPTAANTSCIAPDEYIYRPGTDGVTPPQTQPSKKDKGGPDLRSPFSLEVLINSEGHVCDTRVLSAKDSLSAEKAAKYISEHWTFKPATKQGKPVAVRFIINFGPR